MFEINKSPKTRSGKIHTLHGDIIFPAFLPDATYGTINIVPYSDLQSTGTKEIVTTTLHIEQRLGSEYISKYGGFHKLTGWNRPLLTDSGGWQVFSMIYRNQNKENKISETGCSFIDYRTGNYNFLTPEISQVIQHKIGSDIRLVLDIPIKEDSSLKHTTESVARNTRWAKRSKQMFLDILGITENDFNDKTIKRPLLGAIVQGASNFDLRKSSAEELVDIGFDIYCFGGIPVYKDISWKDNSPKGFFKEMVSFVAQLLPEDKIRYGMGIGTPDDLRFAVDAGWDIFDSVLPTRNARHGYLYVSNGVGDVQYQTYDVLHVKSQRYAFDQDPIDSTCTCKACTTISRAFLRYLIKSKNSVGYHLASIHNLSHYAKVMEDIRTKGSQS